MIKQFTRSLVAVASAAAVVGISAGAAYAAVSPGTYGAVFDAANAKTGVHVQTGTPECTVNADLSIDCAGYELGGVGNTNADAVLTAQWTADVLCNNPAGGKNRNNDIEPHATTLDATVRQDNIRAKNGRMDVAPMGIGPNTGGNPCPNKNWIPEFVNLELVSFVCTLTFDGEAGAFVTIAQP